MDGTTTPLQILRMPIAYDIDHDLRLARIVWSGDVTSDDYAAHLARLLSDAEAMQYRRSIVDVREAAFTIRGAQIDGSIRREALPRLAGSSWCTAVLIREDWQYGSARQYQILLDGLAEVEIFRAEAAALAWLAQRP